MIISIAAVAPSPLNWEVCGDQVYGIEQAVFGDKFLDKNMMMADFNDPETSLVLIKDGESIVGFTYAVPESEGVARVVDTVLAEAYQHKGLISGLMDTLELELKNKGYEYMTRDSMVENGYAGKIEKHYGPTRIVESREIVGDWGKQKYFKIRL